MTFTNLTCTAQWALINAWLYIYTTIKYRTLSPSQRPLWWFFVINIFLSHPAPRNYWSDFCPYSFVFSRISYKWNNTLGMLFESGFFPLSRMLLRFILFVTCTNSSFLPFIGSLLLCCFTMIGLVIHQLMDIMVDWNLELFYLKLL